MTKQKLNMTIGRFMPFTQGHLNMVNEGDGPCIIYRINSSDKEMQKQFNKRTNALTSIKIGSKKFTIDTINRVIEFINKPEGNLEEMEKELLKRPFTNELIDKELDIVKKSNKNIIDVIPVKNMYDALDRFNAFINDHKDEYGPQYWMCGDDRVDNYSEAIDKYEELETFQGSGKLLPNVLKGVLKTNTGKGRTEGVSGTAVRASILNKDKAAFTKIMPRGVAVMFDDFVKAFEDFKNQLQTSIKEHGKMKSLKDYIIESNLDLKTSLVFESREECVKELKELGIKNIQFAEYNNKNGECLFFSKFGDPEKYVNSWSKKLQELNWEKIDNKDYPEHNTKDNQPMYAKPVIYRKDNWDCLIFMRYGYDLDGVNIAFKKNNIK